jgi:hypothetical protein
VQCSGGSDDAVLSAIAAGDASLVGKLALNNPKNVFVNLARGAVQILDCRGVVRGHIPVAREFVLEALSVITESSAD